MKTWAKIDSTLHISDYRGTHLAASLPAPEGYDVGEWIEVVVSAQDPRIVWRFRCDDLPS